MTATRNFVECFFVSNNVGGGVLSSGISSGRVLRRYPRTARFDSGTTRGVRNVLGSRVLSSNVSLLLLFTVWGSDAPISVSSVVRRNSVISFCGKTISIRFGREFSPIPVARRASRRLPGNKQAKTPRTADRRGAVVRPRPRRPCRCRRRPTRTTGRTGKTP